MSHISIYIAPPPFPLLSPKRHKGQLDTPVMPVFTSIELLWTDPFLLEACLSSKYCLSTFCWAEMSSQMYNVRVILAGYFILVSKVLIYCKVVLSRQVIKEDDTKQKMQSWNIVKCEVLLYLNFVLWYYPSNVWYFFKTQSKNSSKPYCCKTFQ